MASLYVIRGNDQGVRYLIPQDTVTIGRDPGNQFTLHDNEVSRRHAEIRLIEGSRTIIDLGSANGLYLNGRRLKEYQLQSGDQIQIGKTLLLYTAPSGNCADQLSSQSVRVEIRSDEQVDETSQIVHSMRPDPFGAESSLWQEAAHEHLRMMYHTTLVISQTLDIDRLLHRIMDLIFEWVQVDRGCVMLFDAEGTHLVPRVSRTRNPGPDPPSLSISKTILDYVFRHKEGVLTSDAGRDARWDAAASIVQMGVREAICVPMQGRYGLVGAIYIDTSSPGLIPTLENPISPRETRRLSQNHLKLMVAIAHQAALAVEDTRYYRGMVQAERLAAVGQTVAVLSHHIKNILQGIRGGSYLIEMGLTDHDETLISKGWRIVEKNQNKISDLVLDMLTFSKEREPALAKDDINRIISDVVELMQGRSDEFELEITWKPECEIPSFLFDAEQMHRAITNLVTNAIDAVKYREIEENHCESIAENVKNRDPVGRVSIRSEHDSANELVLITVEDNGNGIHPDERAEIFRPFTSKKKGRGTGLGLAVTQKIVHEHKGRIRVENSKTGGAKFLIELPIPPEPIVEPTVIENMRE